MTQLAFVSDQLATPGGYAGAEKVLDLVVNAYPGRPIYTTVYHPDRMPQYFKDWDIRPSFIQDLPLGQSNYNLYLPLMPWAVESFNLQAYDVIVSFHHSMAKGVLARPDATHICYCHSPARYVWDQYWAYTDRVPAWQAAAFKVVNPFLRSWDTTSANRVDRFLANSTLTAKRIEKYYQRPAEILPPPVDTGRFHNRPAEDFYLMVGRLVEYKGFDIAVETFNRLKEKLVIVGAGPEQETLKKIAGPTVEIKGRLSDIEVVDLMSRCKGFIFPGEEDFGIVMVEAQAAGKPVIALNRGGARDIILPEETGILVPEKTPDAFVQAVRRAEATDWSTTVIQENARRFDQQRFLEGFHDILGPYLDQAPSPMGSMKLRVAASAGSSHTTLH